MHRRIVGELTGEAVPLAAGAKPEDNGVQASALIDAGPPSLLGRIVLSCRMGSIIFSHSSSGTRQIAGSGFSSVVCSPSSPIVGASSSWWSQTMILDQGGFEIVTKTHNRVQTGR
jgi:hypothetical protein